MNGQCAIVPGDRLIRSAISGRGLDAGEATGLSAPAAGFVGAVVEPG